ncbi:MAG: DUF1428 domain-containing protein [Acidobacteria bacterium]|nr:DUF1428 domain-containing protein [Acidobacteriota bacterium]
MSNYVDVYLLPIAESNVEKYRQTASAAGKIFRKNGALSYREYLASDLNTEGVLPFPSIIELQPGETIIYAAVEYESEQHRNESLKRTMEDPELGTTMPEDCRNIFDYTKMVYGGFKILVDE